MSSVLETMFTPMISPHLHHFAIEDSNHLYRIEWNGHDLYTYSYRIIRRTKQGVWINNYGKEKFVLLSARKKFASETQADALISFIARKHRQIKILSSQLDFAKEGLTFAKSIVDDDSRKDS